MKRLTTLSMLMAMSGFLVLTASAQDKPITPNWVALTPNTIYTPANAPATPKLADLPLMSSLSQYGITWTFEQPARVGHFVNGDWYVVGPDKIVAI